LELQILSEYNTLSYIKCRLHQPRLSLSIEINSAVRNRS